LSVQCIHACLWIYFLANAEKRNLVKAQNAQRKEEIQKRLEKVQTQLGTKSKQSSVNSMTKRGEFIVVERKMNSYRLQQLFSNR
jgi:hypothetical protein